MRDWNLKGFRSYIITSSLSSCIPLYIDYIRISARLKIILILNAKRDRYVDKLNIHCIQPVSNFSGQWFSGGDLWIPYTKGQQCIKHIYIITPSCYWVFKMSRKSREAYWSHYAWHFETLQGCVQTMRKERVRLYNIYHEESHKSLQHTLCNSPRKIITEDTQFAASFAVWVYSYIRKGRML